MSELALQLMPLREHSPRCVWDGKVQYASKARAHRAMKQLNRENATPSPLTRAYRCPRGAGWHLTTSRWYDAR